MHASRARSFRPANRRPGIRVLVPWLTLLLPQLAAGCGADGAESTSGVGANDAEDAGAPGANGVDEQPELVATAAAIDVHTHMASQAFVDMFIGGGVPEAGGEDLVARLDDANVQKAVVLSAGFMAFLDDAGRSHENDFVAQEVKRYPDRLIGFCGIHPGSEDAISEMRRCLALAGMVGVKLQFEGSQLDMDEESHVAALSAVFDEVVEQDVPVLMHVTDPAGLPLSSKGLANVSRVLDEHPEARVVHAHCAGNTDDQSIELWLRVNGSGYRENAFVDVSACLEYFRSAPLATRELMVWRLRNWGIERVLFGSDYLYFMPEATPAETLDTLTQYPFTQEELDTILHNDASKWLRP